jgi:hypothetical protein
LSFGGIGGLSVRKLVKPTKVFCSRPAHEHGLCHVLPTQTQLYERTAAAGILRKADAAMRQELGGFDLPDSVLGQLAELLALVIGDNGMQILDFDQALAYEDDLSHLRNPSDPSQTSFR